MLAFPMTTLDFFLTPEIMYAISGGAFTYPTHSSTMSSTITISGINTVADKIEFICKFPFLLYKCYALSLLHIIADYHSVL